MAKKFFFYCLTVFFVLLIMAGIGEIAFRVFRGAPHPLADIIQKENRYLFPPRTTIHGLSSKEGEFDYEAHINTYGYRGKDFAMPKDPRKLRIFAVGDSFTFGVGSPDDQTIPALLEKALNQKGFSGEVVNAGIGHSSPIRHYVNIRDIHLQYQPDLVLILLDLTDLQDDWRSETHAVYDRQGNISRFDLTYINGQRDWWRTLCHVSAFAKYINDKIVRSFQKMRTLGVAHYIKIAFQGKRAKAVIANQTKSSSAETQLEYDGLLFMRGIEKKDLIDQAWIRSAKYLTMTRDLLKEHHIPMVLVMYPHGIYVGAEEWHEGRATWGFEQNKLYTDTYAFDVVERYAREQNILFINTLSAFPKNSDQQYFFPWDGHMNARGNQIVADTIAGAIPAEFLLD